MPLNRVNRTCRTCDDNFKLQPPCDPNRSSYIAPVYETIAEAKNRNIQSFPLTIDAYFSTAPSFCGEPVNAIEIAWLIEDDNINNSTCIRSVDVYRVSDNSEYLIATSTSANLLPGAFFIDLSGFSIGTEYFIEDNDTRPGWLVMPTPICDVEYRIEITDCSLSRNTYEKTILFNMNFLIYFGYFDALIEPTTPDLSDDTFFEFENVPNLITNIEDDGIATVTSVIEIPIGGGRPYIFIPSNLITFTSSIQIHTSMDGVSFYEDTAWIDTGDIVVDTNGISYNKFRYYFDQTSDIVMTLKVIFNH